MWLFDLCYYLIGLLSNRYWLGGLVVLGVAWFVCLILTSCSCCLDLVVLLVKVVLEWVLVAYCLLCVYCLIT